MGLRRRPGRRPNRARRNHQGLGQGECWAHLSGEGDGVQAWSTNGLVRWDAAWSFQRRADLYAFTAGEWNHEIHHARGVHRPYAADDLALHTRPGTIVYAICQRPQAEGRGPPLTDRATRWQRGAGQPERQHRAVADRAPGE